MLGMTLNTSLPAPSSLACAASSQQTRHQLVDISRLRNDASYANL
jgi:hypothetical protein